MSGSASKLSSPSAQRNREPIRLLLQDVLPTSGLVLELASGTGEHIIHFAQHFSHLIWQPSDPSEEARASIAAWIEDVERDNLRQPLTIDASREDWTIEAADAIIAINMVHISPWAATEGMMKTAGKLLPQGGKLILYGPYRQKGQPFVESNAAFDGSLRERNPEWGVRHLEDVVDLAKRSELDLVRTETMPANNLCVVFERQSA
ncbi:Protein of unknown function [Cohaesibacter sp. ES.047]|uniref:DUF938 domain-containing protein n=1 Tax=Cohaesibacter sp. ES.047 TaxID=1798205 RepID=UPI000BB708FC|nr:DUF938 domain-containing protein [Cohaesibacter sp. ES.047]SNY93484.1 Protein of unknown function [Cohaesibacter sp. ES.047]